MGTVVALKTPTTVLTTGDVAVVVRPGEDGVPEEEVAPHVLAELDDPDSYTSSVLGRSNGKGKPKAEKPAAPAGEPGTDQDAQAPGEPGDAEKADGGQPDAEPKDEADDKPARSRRSRQA